MVGINRHDNALSMIFVDVTVLSVALPTIERELGVSTLGLQWIINAYTLVMAVLVLGGGRLADMWELKKAFCLDLHLCWSLGALWIKSWRGLVCRNSSSTGDWRSFPHFFHTSDHLFIFPLLSTGEGTSGLLC